MVALKSYVRHPGAVLFRNRCVEERPPAPPYTNQESAVDRSSCGLSSIDILELQLLYYKGLYGNMTPLRPALQKKRSDNIEYGEAILAMLKRKAERQLEVIAPAQDEQVVEFWKVLQA